MHSINIALLVYMYIPCSLFQAQYEFIHHALSELVVCGETEVTASNLRAFIDSLKTKSMEEEIAGTQKHSQVKLCNKPSTNTFRDQ